jgi:type I restriction enzyme, R subunit
MTCQLVIAASPTSPERGDDEVIIDRPPDININTDEEPSRKIYVDGLGATILAERVEYLVEQEARY